MPVTKQRGMLISQREKLKLQAISTTHFRNYTNKNGAFTPR